MKRKKTFLFIITLLLLGMLSACATSGNTDTIIVSSVASEVIVSELPIPENSQNEIENIRNVMTAKIGEEEFTVTLENNVAVNDFLEMIEQEPLVLEMEDHGGFEKVGELSTNLPTENNQTTTQAGDIVLYQGDKVVLFYGSNSWSYTRLGKIDDIERLQQALGSGSTTVIFHI